VLLEHLVGTSRIVAAWGQPRATVDAALFHSVYGTDVYRHRSISPARRDDVRARIGGDAERLVWLFAQIDRRDFRARLQEVGGSSPLVVRSGSSMGSVTVEPGDAFTLLTIYMANEFEQTRADDWSPVRLFSILAAMSRSLDPRCGTIPPALTPELRAMTPELDDELIAEYGAACDAFARDPVSAGGAFEALARRFPFVAEPPVFAACSALRAGRFAAAAAWAKRGNRNLELLGAPWDKRLPERAWSQLTSLVRDARRSGACPPEANAFFDKLRVTKQRQEGPTQ